MNKFTLDWKGKRLKVCFFKANADYRLFTPWAIKRVSFCDNFGKCRMILTALSLLHSGMNRKRSGENTTGNLSSTLLLHCLVKFECSTVSVGKDHL